jgi:hypothetical protein
MRVRVPQATQRALLMSRVNTLVMQSSTTPLVGISQQPRDRAINMLAR